MKTVQVHLIIWTTLVSTSQKNSELLFTVTWSLTAGEIRPYSRNGIRSTDKHVS